MTEIHELQKETVKLLQELSNVHRLARTPAMLTINNGYYPSLEEILATLDYYKEIESVKLFVDNNISLVERVREELAEKQSQFEIRNENNLDFLDDMPSNFKVYGKKSSLFELVKSVTIKEIEQAIAVTLSNTLDCEIEVTIDKLVNGDVNLKDIVELRIRMEKNLW